MKRILFISTQLLSIIFILVFMASVILAIAWTSDDFNYPALTAIISLVGSWLMLIAANNLRGELEAK